jgi:hypothetical protein
MSLNDFNDRARLDIRITISGSGEFSPFGTGNSSMNWSLEGNVEAKSFTDDLTIKEKTCGLDFGSTKEFRRFNFTPSSTGNTSGFITLGQYVSVISAEAVKGAFAGMWKVNTSPILSAGGKANGEVAAGAYYVVDLPEDGKVDDPIKLDPKIDNIGRVYPGDFVNVQGTGEFAKWFVGPQTRFPKPDRTFFWQPNEDPFLESGGLADGKLAKPGTIMLPTANFYIEDPEDAVDGMRYFYENQGVIFDGQIWKKNLPDPLVYEPEEGEKEFRNFMVSYVSSQRYESLLEDLHQNKPFIITNQTIDDTNPLEFTITYEGGSTETTSLYFSWLSPLNGVLTNIQPSVPVIYDFFDAWTGYHKANREWVKSRIPGFFGAGFVLQSKNIEPEVTLPLYVEEFVDGNITEIVQTAQNDEGETLTNTFTITVQATPSLS